ncbi:MAG: hypothetical protein ACLR4X_01905 [Clostridia bacterium]|jgi:hypothetical protein
MNGTNVNECFSKCNITINSEKTFCLGGIIGEKDAGNILNCYSEGEIKANCLSEKSYIGGIAGIAATTNVYGVYRMGDINSEYPNAYISGIAPINENKILDGAYYEGNIISKSGISTAISVEANKACEKISNVFYYSNLNNAFIDEYDQEDTANLNEKINSDKLYNILENSSEGTSWKKTSGGYPRLFWE